MTVLGKDGQVEVDVDLVTPISRQSTENHSSMKLHNVCHEIKQTRPMPKLESLTNDERNQIKQRKERMREEQAAEKRRMREEQAAENRRVREEETAVWWRKAERQRKIEEESAEYQRKKLEQIAVECRKQVNGMNTRENLIQQ